MALIAREKLKRRPLAEKGWVPTRLCECCGRAIVLLKLPGYGSKTDPKWWIACFYRGWDYNPWYVSNGSGWDHNAVPHPRKRYAVFKDEERAKARAGKEPEDPFFSLDVADPT